MSTFKVRAFASGLLSALAHNPTFAVREYGGDVTIDPETGEGASLTLHVTAASLELADDVSSRDRQEIEQIMRGQVLDVPRFPTITYDGPASARRTGDGQFDVQINGNLTLHGATHPQPVAAKVIVNATMLRAYGEFPVRQTEYGIKLVAVAGGAIKVKDELTCTFDIVANVSRDSG